MARIRLMTLWIPISPTSGTTPFNMPTDLLNRSDLTFEMYNPNPFAFALEGTPAGSAFLPASMLTASWVVDPYERTPDRVSKKPVQLAARAVSTAGCPLPDVPGGFDYSNSYAVLNYFISGGVS